MNCEIEIVATKDSNSKVHKHYTMTSAIAHASTLRSQGWECEIKKNIDGEVLYLDK